MKIRDIKEKIQSRGFSYALTILDAKYGIGRLEQFFASNWFNPFATIWLNFRSLPFRKAMRFPIFVYGRPKLRCLSGNIDIEGQVKIGMIVFNKVRMMAPGLMTQQSELVNQGTIIFEGPNEIGTGNKIVTYFGSELRIGAKCKIQEQVNIGCMKSIHIGEHSSIVHRCQVFDTNYHYVADLKRLTVPNTIKPLKIGKYCWICNSTTITGGASIPDHTIVASNSLVNHSMINIPENSIIGGIPARLIATGYRRVYNNKIDQECRVYYRDAKSGEIFHLSPDITTDIIIK